MLTTNNLHRNAQQYLEFMTAYNVDADALRSQISTVIRCLGVYAMIISGHPPTEIRAKALSISRVWYEAAKVNPMFKAHTTMFEYIDRHVDALMLRFHTDTIRHPYDEFVRYAVIADPTADGLEVLDFVTGDRIDAKKAFRTNRDMQLGLGFINNEDVVIWNVVNDRIYH